MLIDESYFRGRRKYNRGRMLQGDLESGYESEGNTGDLPGPWVLGICTKQSHVRFIIVQNRTARTLIPLIESNVLPRSLIWTDEWESYTSLSTIGYEHETVNHSENFIDPVTGANTQKIERAWKEGKI